MAVVKIPKGFEEVKDVRVLSEDRIRVVGSKRLSVEVPLNTEFLETSTLDDLIE